MEQGMAARRRKTSTSVFRQDEAVKALFVLGAIVVLIENLDRILPLFLISVVLMLAWLGWKHTQKVRNIKALHDDLTVAIGEHENALISYFHQSRSEDQFGNIDDNRWQKHVDTFLRTKIATHTSDFTSWRNSLLGKQAAEIVNAKTTALVEAHRISNPLASVDVGTLTPTEYEQHCAAILQEAGWNVRITQATRDGGADFVAEKNDWRLVAQCKRYAQPVGNKAVQEVNSAVRLYNGNIACVVAPSGFTRQAQTEAHSLSVHLLHHSTLADFAAKITHI
jgi:restriction system protein